MVAVSNTSPISNLSIIRRLDLLRSQFSKVLIPEAVRTELARMPNPKAKASIETALRDGWLQCRVVANQRLAAALGNDLDQGEAEAIALATEIQADVLLIVRAKSNGEIPSVKAEIDGLRSLACFFLSPLLEAEVMRSVGE